MSRPPLKVGNVVEVTFRYCARYQETGRIISVSDNPGDSMPYMVEFFKDYWQWPFAADEIKDIYAD